MTFDDKEVRLMEDAVFTHNHPEGGSFSPADGRMLLLTMQREIRVVDSEYRYSLKPPEELPYAFEGERGPGLLEEVAWTRSDLLRLKEGGMIEAGELSREEADTEHWHMVWRGIAESYGFRYSREGW